MTPLEEIGLFADVPIEIEAELDRKIMSVREILKLHSGAVVRLTRSAGENIDMYAGEALLGFGEIVVIESTMGVRITDLTNEK